MPPLLYLVAKFLFGADLGPHCLQESAEQLLKMKKKSKEKHPKSLKSGEIWDPSSKDPLQGWSHLSPSPLDTHREDQSPLSPSHPSKFGVPLSQPSPSSLTLQAPCSEVSPDWDWPRHRGQLVLYSVPEGGGNSGEVELPDTGEIHPAHGSSPQRMQD